jgi:hypothetical protein
MQFIAECGIEYGLQIVIQFFFNPPDCLYLKKSIKFLQSYEKSSKEPKDERKKSFSFCIFRAYSYLCRQKSKEL